MGQEKMTCQTAKVKNHKKIKDSFKELNERIV